MKLIKQLLGQLTICALLVLSVQVNAGEKNNFVQLVQLKGVGIPVTLPAGIGGNIVPEGTPCYMVPMLIPRLGIRIGTGYDCITNAGTLATPISEGTATTHYIFDFQERGSIISENRVVIRLATDNDELNPVPADAKPVNENITHILGSFPSEDTIKDGTRKYRRAKGKVRVSGAVSLANFPADIVFDSLYVIELE